MQAGLYHRYSICMMFVDILYIALIINSRPAFYLYLHTDIQILNKYRPEDRKKGFYFILFFLTKHQYTATHTVCLTASVWHLEMRSAAATSHSSLCISLNLSHSDIYLTKHNMDFGILQCQDKPCESSHQCLCFPGCAMPENYFGD